jgi:ABC-type polysaccharide/polyol phosphate transport system ATPase subunit
VATVILENVNAHFPIYGAHQRSLRKALIQRATGGSIEREGKNSDRVTVKALTDISLTLHDGDRLGLIGHNGAGKSTLLKLMAGIYEPVSGTIKVEGRVTPLFDAMPGLDGEDSGYENIITSGMLIGMTRQQIEAKIPEIEEFCELGEYLSLPVRTYSTGMTMRLGFALVTALDPGVLLMDEGFGTGDLRFAERAEARMKDFIGRSRIMVLASHSDRTIRSMCNKAIMMEAGRIVASGPVDEICDRYYESVHVAAQTARTARFAAKEPVITAKTEAGEILVRNANLEDRLKRATGAIRFTSIVARDQSGLARWEYNQGETVNFRFEYEVFEKVSRVALLFRLYLADDQSSASSIQYVTDIFETISSIQLEAGSRGAVELTLPGLKLMPNNFRLYVCFTPPKRTTSYDVLDKNVGLPALVVRPSFAGDRRLGAVSLDYELRNIGAEEPAETSATPSIIASSES